MSGEPPTVSGPGMPPCGAWRMNLSEGEEVVLDLHPHWSQPRRPGAGAAGGRLLAGFGVALIPHGGGQEIERWIVIGVAVIVVVWLTVLPYLRWLTTRYVLTTDRLVIRTGILARHGRDVPLNRINDVSFSETVFERDVAQRHAGGRVGRRARPDLARRTCPESSTCNASSTGWSSEHQGGVPPSDDGAAT